MPPPIPTDVLRELAKTKDPLVRRLLWEISRLRAVALRAHQLERMIRDDYKNDIDNSVHLVLMELRELLGKEPVIQEEEERQKKVLFPGRPQR